MAPTPYPLPESTRQTAVLLGDGSTTYGPFGTGWGIFDIDDVLVEKRAVATTVFAEVTDAVIAKVNPAAAYDFFYVTFPAPLTSAFEYRITGKRLQERELAVTRGGAIDGVALEKELSKVSVVLQEQRRDIDNTAVMVAGDAASSALADRLLAQAAAASAAASAAILAGALAILVGNAGGTANAPTLTHASFAGLVAYPNDMLVVFRITAANLGAMTLTALPLAAKPFVDRTGDAFVGGEWQIGDICIAEFNVTNNQFRSLERIIDIVLSDKLNIYTVLQTFNGNISVASKATFTKQMIYPPVTLTDAVTIAWDMDTGSNFEVTIAGNRTLGVFTGGTNGQKGTLRIIQDPTGGRTLDLSNAVYDFTGNVIRNISTLPNAVTEYAWERIGAAALRLTWMWSSAPLGANRVNKLVDETVVASTVLQNDDVLAFPVAANAKYWFKMMLHINSPAAADIKLQLTGPAAPTLVRFGGVLVTAADGLAQFYRTAFSSLFSPNSVDPDYIITIDGVVQNGANAGTVQLQWAQIAASGTTTIYAGSYLEFGLVS